MVNDLVIDRLLDAIGQFLNGTLEDALVFEPLPRAIVVGCFGVGDVILPPHEVSRVAETAASVGGIATELDFLSVDLCGEILNVVLLACHNRQNLRV